MFCWQLDCNRVNLIFEFITSEVTDWKGVSSGHNLMLWNLQVGFLCPDFFGPSWNRSPTTYLSTVCVRGWTRCLLYECSDWIFSSVVGVGLHWAAFTSGMWVTYNSHKKALLTLYVACARMLITHSYTFGVTLLLGSSKHPLLSPHKALASCRSLASMWATTSQAMSTAYTRGQYLEDSSKSAWSLAWELPRTEVTMHAAWMV